jgi:hypothetical protein
LLVQPQGAWRYLLLVLRWVRLSVRLLLVLVRFLGPLLALAQPPLLA